MTPDSFRGGMRPVGGGPGWHFSDLRPGLDGTCGEVLWFTNPKFYIAPEHDYLIDLFFGAIDGQAWQNGSFGTGAMRHLPDSGGWNDQAAPVLDALRIIGECIREMQK